MFVKEADIKEALNVNLPKWPQLKIVGDYITIDQAKEIILRTDDFFADCSEYTGGNVREWNEAARKVLFGEKVLDLYEKSEWPEKHKITVAINNAVNHLETSYVHNTWASSCYVGGPYGWCSPEGEIFYRDNVGKWPSAGSILADLTTIAHTFPFVRLTATLMSGESCEDDTKPVISFEVADGKVSVYKEPVDLEVGKKDIAEDFMAKMNDPRRELGLQDEWIYEYGEKIRPILEKELNL